MLKDIDLRDLFGEFLYDEKVEGMEFELISLREFSE